MIDKVDPVYIQLNIRVDPYPIPDPFHRFIEGVPLAEYIRQDIERKIACYPTATIVTQQIVTVHDVINRQSS